MRRRFAALLAGVLLAGVLLAGGCGSGSGPPVIRAGMTCASCGMEIRDLHFACARREGRAWRRYDAIECLLRDPGAAAESWLTDYDALALHEASALWVVQGEFPSPMGGGFAAFAARGAADSVAAMTHGRVGRLAAFAAPGSP